MPLPGLTRDVVTISRPVNTADSEGNFAAGLGTATILMGAYGNPTSLEQSQAAQRGQQLDAVVVVPSGTVVDAGDVVTVKGVTWVCTATRDVRLHTRVFLRNAP